MHEPSRETARRRLAENQLKGWRKHMWCIPRVNGTHVARMGSARALRPDPDLLRPVVCFDECPTQLIGEMRQPIPAAPQARRVLRRRDFHYIGKHAGRLNMVEIENVMMSSSAPWTRSARVGAGDMSIMSSGWGLSPSGDSGKPDRAPARYPAIEIDMRET